MKKILLFLILLLVSTTGVFAQQIILQDSIVGSMTLSADKTYLIRGFVYIVDGGTLTIPAGTVLFGEKSSKGTLIAERGGKIIAQGTAQKPIIFTSQFPVGGRASGDWGGIVLCGKAPINQNNSINGGLFDGGDAQIEGGPRSHYGGTDVHDYSGKLSYVRIEFPGIALAPNNEINGLTLGGVGDYTVLDHIQVSYSGDDSYEWFGGTVNEKYLIAFKGLDDEWDTDFGYSGKAQFCVSLRDPNIADVSVSNGFESDNDNPANFWNPRTSAIFCNMTVVGPQSDTSQVVNPLFGRGAHIRRNTLLNIYNSIVMGWPTGILFDQTGVTNASIGDTIQIRNCIWGGLRVGNDFVSNVSGFNAGYWFATPSFGNRGFTQPSSILLAAPFNLTAPDWTPKLNSPASTGASFTNPRLANDPFFTKTTYVGAFGPGPRWDSLWSNYDPQNTNYNGIAQAVVTDVNFPTISVNTTKDSAVVVIKNAGYSPIQITNTALLDSSRFKIIGASYPFSLQRGDTKTITIRFAPNDTTTVTTKLRFTTSDAQIVDVNLKGKAATPAPILTVASSLDFALVRANESVDHTLDISNTGTATLSLTSFSITGTDAQQFTIVGGSPFYDIAPGAKQTVTIRFSPTSVGDKSATFQFSNNATGGIKTISLTGKGIIVYGQDVLKDSIVGNVTLTNDRTWLIRGFVYVVNGATLNIEPGTVIFGEKATKGTLIVERGGKLNAEGTQSEPILFLSQQAPGQRASGDWGGLVLCGKAPINQNNSINGGLFAGGDAQIEGGPRSHYGGTDVNDNSGKLRYIRIEFPGIALAPNNEINGLTMGGVGAGTTIDHIQVSYSGDDSYEWFGGTVNAKYLIALKGLDDDWDTDFGFSGKVQFAVSLRDPNIADVSTSNGFESDNDNPANFWNPRTSAIFCNMTVVGPQSDTGQIVNPLFGRGAHIRRNTLLNIYNSVVMGWPTGLLMDQTGVTLASTNDTLQVRNNIWAGLHIGKAFTSNIPAFDATAWFKSVAYGNSDFVQPAEVKLSAPFNLSAPNFTPTTGSPALVGGSFANARLSDPFFQPTTYRGAFGPGPRWDSIWTNYDPMNLVYAPKPTLALTAINFGQTKINTSKDSIVTVVLMNTGNVVLSVSSWGLLDSSLFTIIGGTAPFTVKAGGSKSITLRFHPKAVGSFNTKLRFAFTTGEQAQELALNGEGVLDAGVSNMIATRSIELFQNSPNPFNENTEISYFLPKTSIVSLEVLDVTGKILSVLATGMQQEGLHLSHFSSTGLTNGTYTVRLTVGNDVMTTRMMLVK